ncbi:MAG: stage III sporulation protein D [Clostridiales bacterium]|nr:stage III sporulation protein D [Clostridiales bacterium]
MKAYIKQRTLDEARYITENQVTIRKTAQVFGLSKSTVHNDLSRRLRKYDAVLYESVKKILDKNFDEKHIRGGMSTKQKYESKDVEKSL